MGSDSSLRELVLIIDTRENNPYKFKGCPVVFAKLDTGDYSLKGLTHRVAIERKEFGDFLSCVGHNRTRFMKEMERLRVIEHAALVIETDYSNIAHGRHPRSRVNPDTAIGTLVKLASWGIVTVCAGGRAEAEDWTLRFLKRVFLMVRGVKR